MLQGFPYVPYGWNYPAWSVSVEFFGYIAIFPLSLFLLKHRTAKKQGFLIAVALSSLFAICGSTGVLGEWTSLGRISFEFLSGAFLFHGLKASPKVRKLVTSALPALLVGSIVWCYVAPKLGAGHSTHYLLVALCPVFLAGISSDGGMVSRFLATPTVRYLGLISYSLYMSHALVQKFLKVALPSGKLADASTVSRLVGFGIHLLLPLLVATILYHFWEEPARKWVQRWGRRWTQPS